MMRHNNVSAEDKAKWIRQWTDYVQSLRTISWQSKNMREVEELDAIIDRLKTIIKRNAERLKP
jgi:hypothetical protein